ncbi:SdrD B-like domain-containing protein [Fibrella sp. ES10-3-2-2]|nr:hypothetical protein A6C57_16055 [Fibrella sp. ES10-3-2-2]
MKNNYLFSPWASVCARWLGYCTLLIFGLLLPAFVHAQSISGTVFRDFNATGTYTVQTSTTHTYGEPGVPGVIVTAYSSNSAVAPISTTTNSSGSYTLAVGSSNEFRVEFTNVITGDFDGFVVTGTATTQSRSGVRFVTGGTTGVNFGINYPASYCGIANPYLATSCYTNGDPVASSAISGTSSPAQDPWLVGWQYDGAATGRNTYLSKGSIGATWGLAYHRSSDLLFAAAFLKRHSGFGTGGPGQIYAIKMTNPTSASANVTPFVNLANLGIDVGTTPRVSLSAPTALTNALPTNKTTPNYDVAAFDQVGKMSLGDIDISDDDKTLWVINLKERSLIELPIGSPAVAPTTYTRHILPTTSCVNGVLRPFAAKFYRGKVYVGAVCSAELTGGTASNLQAYVYAHDPAGATSNFTQVLTFPLNYTRGYVTSRGLDGGTGTSFTTANWRPWIDQWTDIPSSFTSTGYDQTVCPQPVLSDIEFDNNGEMILGFFDRFGHQAGNNNYSTTTSSTLVYEATAAGDLLRAGRKLDGTYQLESNASVVNIPANSIVPTTVTTIATNQSIPQGPGGGEFYWQDMYLNNATGKDTDPTSSTADGGHQEILVGGIAQWPGMNEVVATAFDPFTNFRAAGARYFNNRTGTSDFQYQVLAQDGGLTEPQRVATFGKAASLGDLEIICEQSPIQIGNRVWKDTNNNGIQDAGEPALAGVVVLLKGPGLPTAGVSVTTNSSGEYYFSNSTSGTTATGFVYSLTGLTAGSSYSLTFPLSASAGTLNLSGKPNSATGTNADAIDTDVSSSGLVSFTLGNAGENNFTYDAGYIDLCAIATTATASSCSPATNQYTVSGTISLTNTTAGTITLSDGVRSTTLAVTATTTSIPYSLSGLISGTGAHTLTVSLPGCGTATAVYTAPAACSVAASISVTSATVCYGSATSLTATGCNGTVTWSNSTTGTVLNTPTLTQTTSYTATCTTISGNTATAVATVTVLPQPVLNLAASSTLVTVNTPVSLSAIGCQGTVSWSNGTTGSTITVTPTLASQTYSATCTTGPGCFTTASIVINTAPPATLSVNSATICYGSTATLSTSGCVGTVTWSNATTGTSLTTPALTSTTSYTATCTTNTGSTATAVATVTVLAQPLLSLQASSTLVTTGTPVNLSAIGCSGTVTWSTGITGASITVTPIQATQTYSATCTTGPACFTTASIVINTAPPASLVVTSATICYGSTASLSALGCNGTVTWSNGATGTSLTTPTLTSNTNYTATCTTATSSTFAVATVTVLPQPVLSLQASSTLLTTGTPVSLSAIGCQGTVSWSTSQTGSTITVNPSQATQTYSATCTTGPGCFTTASIVINTAPPATLSVNSATICYGSTATLSTSGCVGTVTWSTGATGTSITTPALTNTTSYTANCTTSTGSTATAVATVTVLAQPLLSLQASSTLVTVGTPVTLSAMGCSGTITWSTGATGASITVSPIQATQIYSATCTTGPGCFTSASLVITTEEPANLIVTSATICYGSSATLTAAGCAGTISWNTGTTGTSLTTPVLTQTTSYTATCTTATSSTFAVGTVTVLAQPVLSLQASATLVTTGTPVSLSAVGCAGTVTWSTNQTGSSITVTPTLATQTYSATCTTGPGCFTSASIVVNTAPPANLIVTSATICYGTTASLSALGCAGSVSWNTGTTDAVLNTGALTQTTSYTATCTTATSSTFAVGTVTVLEQPLLSLQASTTLVTMGTPVSLSAVGCSGTVSWSTGATGSSITVTPMLASQTYSATCTTGPGCFTSASLVITTEEPANLIVTSATICYGSSATLSAAGCAGTITWNTGTTGTSLTTPVLTNTTSYTATCTTATSTTFAVATVTVLDQPLLSLQASATLVAAGTPVSLSAIGCAGTITWSNGATGSTITVVPTQASQTYSATCTTGPACFTSASIQLLTTAALGDFVFEDVNKDGVQDSNDLPIAGATVTLLQNGSPVATTTTDASGLYSFTGLTPGTPYSVSFTTPAGFSTTTGANVGGDDGLDSDPVNGVTVSLTLGAGEVNASLDAGFVRPLVPPVSYALAKSVDQSRAEKGGVVTYTISLTNTSPTTGTNVVVTDAFSSSALTLVGSVTVSAGSFTPSPTGGQWTIPSLTGGSVVTLQYRAQVEVEGITYNVATAPDGHTATACVTVPYHVCDNVPFEFLISAPASFSAYQWSRNGTPIPGATSPTYSVTEAGEYTVSVTNQTGCTDGTCCPFVIITDAAPSLTAVGVAANCIGATPQNTASISLVGSSPNAVNYNVSLGSSFTTPLLAANQSLSAVSGGVLLANQANPDEAPGQSYTIRVYSATGCYSDVVVVIPPTQCACPAVKCTPFTVRKVAKK